MSSLLSRIACRANLFLMRTVFRDYAPDLPAIPVTPRPVNLKGALKEVLVLYKKRIAKDVIVRIAQIYPSDTSDTTPWSRKRSQFLMLILEDERFGTAFAMRLSVFRKLVIYINSINLLTARRFCEHELRKLQRLEKERDAEIGSN